MAPGQEDRAKKARRFSAGVFALVGLFGVVVGGHDGFVSVEVSSRVGGWILMIAGVLLVGASAMLVSSSGQASLVGLLASPIAAGIGAGFLITELISPDHDANVFWICALLAVVVIVFAFILRSRPRDLVAVAVGLYGVAYLYLAAQHGSDERMVIWTAMVTAAGLAAYFLWRFDRPTVELSPNKIAGAVVAVISLSGLVAVAQFWYTTQYLPNSLAASLSVHTQLDRLGTSNGRDIVRVQMNVENTSGIQVKVLDSLYRVTGARVGRVGKPSSTITDRLAGPELGKGATNSYQTPRAWRLIQAGHVMPSQSWLDPGDVYSRNFLVYVPQGNFDEVRSFAQLFVAKGQALTLSQRPSFGPRRERYPNGIHAVVTQYAINETSWVRQLTRGNRVLDLEWVTSDPARERPPSVSMRATGRGMGPVNGTAPTTGTGPIPTKVAARYPELRLLVFRSDTEADRRASIAYNDRLASIYGIAQTASEAQLPLGTDHSR